MASIAERDSACGRLPVFAENGDANGGLGASAQVVGYSLDVGLGGKGRRRLSSHAQHGNGQRNTECCNQLKPHAAAMKTSHLHLPKNCRTRISPGCRSVDLYCIRQGVAGANGYGRTGHLLDAEACDWARAGALDGSIRGRRTRRALCFESGSTGDLSFLAFPEVAASWGRVDLRSTVSRCDNPGTAVGLR
jgi:hypothetical protein